MGAFAPQAASAGWSRSYVVDWLEPAFFHGAPKGEVTAPGADCPKGTAPSVGFRKMLTTRWRPVEQTEHYVRAENRGDLQRVMRFRGPNYENVYENPTLAPDLGLPPVTGKIAYGFDLDGSPKTGGFSSPEGAPGIDNGYYRAAGCWASYRGPAYGSQRGIGINGYMRDGLYTIVIVMSGEQDPMNDDNVTFAFYQSKDRIVKDAAGKVARDATFAIEPTVRTQSLVKARIRDGVVETVGPSEIRLRDEAWNARMPDQLQLTQGRFRFALTPDGGLEGYFGGYRDWKVLYKKQAVNGRDTETNQAIDLPSFYYALQRHADADPDPKTRKNRRISTAYRLRAVPAFVTTPDGTQVVTAPRVFDGSATQMAAAGGDQ